MLVFNVFKWLVLLGLVVTNTIQTVAYLRVKKHFRRLPIVAAEITQCRLIRSFEERWIVEADIRFRYTFRGKEYESHTPALRSAQLFPVWNYESALVDRYRVGSIVNAHVIPDVPEAAFLEVAPFSLSSAVLLPIVTLAYAAFILGYWWFVWQIIKGAFE